MVNEMKIQNVKGGYDFLPKDQKIRNYINDILRNIFEEYGYLPIETPILCYYDMLAGKYDENNDILNEIYKLKDQGNRNLGLRYDLTVPFAKFIALNKNDIKLPFKRYEINKVFRDGPVKVGRDREFTQCDVDVVGLPGQMIEAELLDLYVKAFAKLNIEIKIKYNSRNLMRGLIKECNVSLELIPKIITIIDKIDKLSEDEFRKELFALTLKEKDINKLLKYFNLSLEELNKIFLNTTNDDIMKGLEELNNLVSFIKAINIEKYCVFTSSLARGQDYYTGNVFEVYEVTGELTCAIGGGGRYDKMITEFIGDEQIYPAVGISFGLTSIFELLKTREDLYANNFIDLYMIPLGTEKEALRIVNDIRKMGIKVDIEMTSRKVKKSLDYCNKEKIPFVVILGEAELENKVFKLKDMINKCEYEISFDNLDEIKKTINS